MILYVSDLDGTLANSREQLSGETVRIINELLDEGMAFTIATARSMASAAEIIAPLCLRLPIIYNNGVFIYHPLEKKNISAWFMNTATVNRLLDDCRRHGISPLLYVQDEEGKMSVFYRGVFHPGKNNISAGGWPRATGVLSWWTTSKRCRGNGCIPFWLLGMTRIWRTCTAAGANTRK